MVLVTSNFLSQGGGWEVVVFKEVLRGAVTQEATENPAMRYI